MVKWHARLGEGSDRVGTLVAAAEGTGPYAVIVLLDPPRFALPEGAYPRAQRKAVDLFGRVPGGVPFLVGIQEDFWREAERSGVIGGRTAPTDDYLDRGGLGIVAALAGAPALERVRLEDPQSFDEYKALEARAIAFMSAASPVFAPVTAAFREAQRTHLSPRVAEVVALTVRYDAHEMRPLEYATALLAAARQAGFDLSSGSYRSLLMQQQLAQVDKELDNDRAKEELHVLAGMIGQAATPATLRPRAAWELARWPLEVFETDKPETEASLAAIDEILARADPSPPPPDIVERAIKVARDGCFTEGYRVLPGVDKSDLLGGHQERSSSLLELAVVLGVDVDLVPTLRLHVRQGGLVHTLNRLSGGNIASLVSASLTELARELIAKLAETATDVAICGLQPTIAVMEALGRFQLVHDEHLRSVVVNLDFEAVARALHDAAVPVPEGWVARAVALGEGLQAFRDYYDLTLLRGKDLAAELIRALKKRDLNRGVLYCDGYLHETLARWFDAHDVSYWMAAPSW